VSLLRIQRDGNKKFLGVGIIRWAGQFVHGGDGRAHEGHSVDSAYDGQEGQDLAEMIAYNLIILDILLPEKDGLSVCRDLRRRRIYTPNPIPLLVIWFFHGTLVAGVGGYWLAGKALRPVKMMTRTAKKYTCRC
jgi:CheY-like chemotaxis protein